MARAPAGSARCGSRPTPACREPPHRAAPRRLVEPRSGARCIEREHHATRTAAGLFDLTPFTKVEVEGAGRRRLAQPRVRVRDGPPRRPHRLHDGARRRTAASSATSPSRAWPRTATSSSPAAAPARATSPGCAACCPRAAACACATSPGRRPCVGLWGPRARDVLAPLAARRPRQRGVPVHGRARRSGRARAGPGAAHLLRRRARLGALRADRVRPLAVGPAARGGRPARRRRPAAWAPSSRCASRRATASPASTCTASTRRTRRGSASPCTSPSRRSSGARPCSRARAGRPQRLVPIVLDDPDAPPLGGEPLRVDGARRARHERGLRRQRRRESIAYGCLPVRRPSRDSASPCASSTAPSADVSRRAALRPARRAPAGLISTSP